MDLIKKIKRNPVSAAFGLAVVGCLAMSSGNISKTMNSMALIREEAAKNNSADMLLHTSEEAAQAQSEIAKQRYKEGCVMVVAMSHPNFYTTLSEGEPVLDRIRKKPLPVGTIVCDANGNTAKIVLSDSNKAVVGELAFTGDRTTVLAARRSHKHAYSLPDQQ
jgi:hypothetical protein